MKSFLARRAAAPLGPLWKPLAKTAAKKAAEKKVNPYKPRPPGVASKNARRRHVPCGGPGAHRPTWAPPLPGPKRAARATGRRRTRRACGREPRPGDGEGGALASAAPGRRAAVTADQVA